MCIALFQFVVMQTIQQIALLHIVNGMLREEKSCVAALGIISMLHVVEIDKKNYLK